MKKAAAACGSLYYMVINLYLSVPSPIFTAWATQVCHSASGCVIWKLSPECSCCLRFSARMLPSMAGILLQRSAHALSRATGSNEASIPIFGMIGMSFSEWQSQFGDTSQISDT